VCKVVFIGFLILYLAALSLWLIGTFGWFGANKDPLSGIFLIILGQPWARWVDALPEALWPFGGAAAPAVNLGVLYFVCRFLAGKPA